MVPLVKRAWPARSAPKASIAARAASTSLSPPSPGVDGRSADGGGDQQDDDSQEEVLSADPRRPQSSSIGAAAAAAAASGAIAGGEDDVDISKAELLAASVAVKLSNHVYKLGELESWVARDGFVLRAEGVTSCTRWYVCDKVEREGGGGGVTTQRWVVVRGAAWNNEAVDRVKLSYQISRAWPQPLHPAVPVVIHTGVAEMADEFWPEVSPWIASVPASAKMCFAGHSLGGSMAMLLMAWSQLRLGVDADRFAPLHTFGSPPVMAVDEWEMQKRGIERASKRVGAAAARGADWMGELAGAFGVGRGGFVGASSGNGPAGGGASRDSGGWPSGGGDGDGVEWAKMDPLTLAGLSPDAVRSFVLSNDPVPRMWNSANPIFGSVAANDTISSVLATREWLFGSGIISQRRFLYETVGTLYWLQWSAADGTVLSVHRGDGSALVEKLKLAITPRGVQGGGGGQESGGSSWDISGWLTAVQGTLDHNAQNYVDSVAYVALKRLGHSTSKAL